MWRQDARGYGQWYARPRDGVGRERCRRGKSLRVRDLVGMDDVVPPEHQSHLDHDLFVMDRDHIAEPMSIDRVDNVPNCDTWPLSSAYRGNGVADQDTRGY